MSQSNRLFVSLIASHLFSVEMGYQSIASLYPAIQREIPGETRSLIAGEELKELSSRNDLIL